MEIQFLNVCKQLNNCDRYILENILLLFVNQLEFSNYFSLWDDAVIKNFTTE